jgi:hypothetical protein
MKSLEHFTSRLWISSILKDVLIHLFSRFDTSLNTMIVFFLHQLFMKKYSFVLVILFKELEQFKEDSMKLKTINAFHAAMYYIFINNGLIKKILVYKSFTSIFQRKSSLFINNFNYSCFSCKMLRWINWS